MTFVNAEYRPIGDDPAKTSALVNEIVVEQHADDAPFLWTIRDRAVSAATFTLKDLARWDERLEAHLDGLRVAGGFGWRLCERGLANEKPGEVFTAAVLAFGGDDPVRVQRVIEAGCATPELERADLRAGLAGLSTDRSHARATSPLRHARGSASGHCFPCCPSARRFASVGSSDLGLARSAKGARTQGRGRARATGPIALRLPVDLKRRSRRFDSMPPVPLRSSGSGLLRPRRCARSRSGAPATPSEP